MKQHSFKCEGCGVIFCRNRNPHQIYCSKPECQRARRRKWQAAKRRNDEDYLENQKRAQHEWRQKHRHYMAQYRELSPAYVSKNRDLTRKRQSQRRAAMFVKMDALTKEPSVKTGVYRMTPLDGLFVKMDALTVQLTVLQHVSQHIRGNGVFVNEDVIEAAHSLC